MFFYSYCSGRYGLASHNPLRKLSIALGNHAYTSSTGLCLVLPIGNALPKHLQCSRTYLLIVRLALGTATVVFFLLGLGVALVFAGPAGKRNYFCHESQSITAVFRWEADHSNPNTGVELNIPDYVLDAINGILVLSVVLTFPLQFHPAVEVLEKMFKIGPSVMHGVGNVASQNGGNGGASSGGGGGGGDVSKAQLREMSLTAEGAPVPEKIMSLSSHDASINGGTGGNSHVLSDSTQAWRLTMMTPPADDENHPRGFSSSSNEPKDNHGEEQIPGGPFKFRLMRVVLVGLCAVCAAWVHKVRTILYLSSRVHALSSTHLFPTICESRTGLWL